MVALAVGVRRQVFLERLPEVRHAAAVGPLLRGVLAPGDTSQQLLGEATRVLRGQVAAAADGDAPVGRLPPPSSDAVVDDERLRTRGLDADPEADEPGVPGDPGLVGGLEGFDRALGQGQLDSGGPFAGGGAHDASRFGRGRKADATQRQHLPSVTRTVGNTGEPVSEGSASAHR